MSDQHQRRALRYEKLESRNLLAGLAGCSAWQNPLDSNDLDADGEVSPIDALVAFNALNVGLVGKLADSTAPPALLGRVEGAAGSFMDANGDGELSAIDPLLVINELNRHRQDKLPLDLPAEDQQGDTIEDASELTPTSGVAKVRALLNAAEDVDVFSVVAGKDELQVTLFFRGSGVTVTVLSLDDEGNPVAVGSETTTAAGARGGVRLHLEVTAGTYYIQVSGEGEATGPYGLQVVNYDDKQYRPVPDAELGDDVHADSFNSTDPVPTLLTFDHHRAAVTSNIDPKDDTATEDLVETDTDVFQVDAQEGKLVLHARAKFEVELAVLNAEGDVVQDWTSAHRRPLIVDVASGTYYIAIRAVPSADTDPLTGPYRLEVANRSVPGRPPHDEKDPTRFAQALFERADSNDDGSVSPEEFVVAMPPRKQTMADEFFERWAGEDDLLSLEELIDGLESLHQHERLPPSPGTLRPLGPRRLA